MKSIAARDVAPTPWKNGGGLTRELLRWPVADDWTLRVSVADITADGPFSPFPGVVRWFAAISGAGVHLRWPTLARDVRPGDAPLRFDGADAPDCTLLDGPTRDLNVMVRGDRAEAVVAAASLTDRVEPGAELGFGFFSLQPLTLHGASDTPLDLPDLSLVWCEPPFTAARAWCLEPPPGTDAACERTLPGYWIRLLPSAR